MNVGAYGRRSLHNYLSLLPRTDKVLSKCQDIYLGWSMDQLYLRMALTILKFSLWVIEWMHRTGTPTSVCRSGIESFDASTARVMEKAFLMEEEHDEHA